VLSLELGVLSCSERMTFDPLRRHNRNSSLSIFLVRLRERKPFAGSTWRFNRMRLPVTSMHAGSAPLWRSIKGVHGKSWMGSVAENDNSHHGECKRVYAHAADPPLPHAPWHFLYFFPLPQGQGSLRPTLFSARWAGAGADTGSSPRFNVSLGCGCERTG
jgi:hypothetical protein